MMSENPENRMPLSQPARSVAPDPPGVAFAAPRPGRRDSAPRPDFAEPFVGDPPDAAADLGERPERSDVAAGVVASDFEDAAVAASALADAAFGDADFAGADFAGADFADFADPGFTASVVAGSAFEPRDCALGRPGTAGRRGTPDVLGGRGASGCIAPPHRPGKENGGGPAATPVTKSKPFRP